MSYRFLFVLILLIIHLLPAGAWAISEWQENNASLDIRGFGRLLGSYLHYPYDSQIQERDDEAWAGIFRVLADGDLGRRWDFEINLMQEVVSLSQNTNGIARRDVERSDLFAWQQTEKQDYLAQLSIDTLALHWRSVSLDVSMGRQPVNLATTFFFTPNDFFAPFAAQTFFRTYKPGVDAGRAELRLGELSQVSLLGVLAYDEDDQSDTGWSRGPDWQRTSFLVRFLTNSWNWEWSILGGTVHDENMIGISAQGELLSWLGIRAEGNFSSPENSETDDVIELCLGLEHRFENSLDVRLEYFYHGKGYGSIEEANIAKLAGDVAIGYLGKNYTAMSASYQFSPLIVGQALVLVNWTDQSRLWSAYAVYSLSDESDLAFTLSLPDGERPDITRINSEFGSLPYSGSLEYRVYF